MYRLPPFGDILRETFGRFFQEWLSALVLSLVYGALAVLVVWPVAESLAVAARIPDESRANFLAEGGVTLSSYFLVAIIIFIFYSAVNVIWVRCALLGRDEALTDGIYGWFLRTLLMGWRQIVAIGWVIAAGLLGLLFAWVSGRFEVIFIVVIPAAVAIAPAVGVAMVGAAVDEPVTIRRAIAILGPSLFKLMLPAIVLGLIAAIPTIFEAIQTAQAAAEPIDAERLVPTYLTFRFIEQTLGAWVTFLWLTLCGVVLGHRLESDGGELP